jgi:MFS family permease
VNPVARSAALQRRQVLVLLTALSALAFMDRQIIAVLIQPVKAEFGLSDLQIGLVTGLGYALTFALIGVPLGRRADRGGRRNLVAWCRGLGGLLAALGGAASGFWTLMASRAGGAISDAGAAPASMSMLADLYPPEQRSRAMSVFGTGGSIGALLAMVVGAWLAQRYGWRATVVLVGSSTLGLSALLRFGVTEPARAAVPTAPAALAAAELQGGAVGAIWREPVTRWLIVAAACALLAGYAFGTWNTALLVRRHGLSLQGAGWVSGTAALASVLGGLAAGALTDHLARRDLRWQIGVPMLGVGIALPCALAYLALPVGAIAPAVALVTAFAFFITWWAAPAYAALSLIVPPQRRATASAMLMLAGAVLASGLGPILTGGLSDVLEARLPGDGLRIALACMVGMLLPGLFAFARVRATYPAAHRALHPAALPR